MSDTYDEKIEGKSTTEKQSFPDMRKNRFSERLKFAMAGTTNTVLANMCGVSESTIRSYLAGRTTPTLTVLGSISKALNIPETWLVSGAPEGQHVIEEPVITKRSNSSVSVDAEMLRKLIEAIDRLDRMRDRPLSPDKKAKIIALLYEYCEKKKVVNDESIAMMMDIAS